MLKVITTVHSTTLVLSLHRVPEFREGGVDPVLERKSLLKHWPKLFRDLVEAVDPDYAEHGVTDKQQQDEEPVDVEQPLVELTGAQTTDELQHTGLSEEREVGVQEAWLGERQTGHQGALRVGDQDLGGDDGESDNGHEQHGVTRVDPEAVIAHSLGG